jgi:hypothetical protein
MTLASATLLAASPTRAQSVKLFTDTKELGYEVAMPANCRHDIKPGTIETICSPDLDANKAKWLKAAGAWLFELDGEIAPADATAYSLAALSSELPDMVCGESDASKVRVENVSHTKDAGRETFAADVTCPPVSFLNLSERRAKVQVIVAGQKRFRMMVRAPSADADRALPMARAFFDSFKLLN